MREKGEDRKGGGGRGREKERKEEEAEVGRKKEGRRSPRTLVG